MCFAYFLFFKSSLWSVLNRQVDVLLYFLIFSVLFGVDVVMCYGSLWSVLNR